MSKPGRSEQPASRGANRGPAQDDSDEDDASAGPSRPAGPYRTDPKGDELRKEAEKKVKSFGWFSGNDKYNDAIELLEKAAAQYKMNKNWSDTQRPGHVLGHARMMLSGRESCSPSPSQPFSRRFLLISLLSVRRQEAGEVYMRCAEIYKTNLKEAHDEAMAYDHAAKAFKNVNTKGW